MVSALNAANKEITITTRGREPKTIMIDASAADFRRYAPDSVKFADAKPSSFADLQSGDTVRALGDKSEDGTHLKAEELVSGAFETIAGTVDSVDPATGEGAAHESANQEAVAGPNQCRHSCCDGWIRRWRPCWRGGFVRTRPPADRPTAHGSRGRQAPAPEHPADLADPGGFGVADPAARWRGGGDLQQILERMPQLALSELKKGDAVIVSSSKGPGDSSVTAFAFVAGVEPFLAAAPRTAGQVNLGSWNLDLGGGDRSNKPGRLANKGSLNESPTATVLLLLTLCRR